MIEKIIYKYIIDRSGRVTLPENAEILKIEFQNDDLYLWALTSTEGEPTKDHLYYIYATGQVIYETKITYVTTLFAGILVWHIFKDELPKAKDIQPTE